MSQRSTAPGTARRTALLIAMAAALAIPLARVSADSGFPPDGSGRNVLLASDGVSVTAHEENGAGSICIETATELGCADVTSGWLTTAGFVTGLTGVTVTVNDAGGATRDVVVSFSLTLAGAIVPTSEVIDGSDETCSITWTVKERTAPVTGTVTYDGATYPVGEGSKSVIRTLKEKVRC